MGQVQSVIARYTINVLHIGLVIVALVFCRVLVSMESLNLGTFALFHHLHEDHVELDDESSIPTHTHTHQHADGSTHSHTHKATHCIKINGGDSLHDCFWSGILFHPHYFGYHSAFSLSVMPVRENFLASLFRPPILT